ncbi:MAG: hypothetical protein EA403_04525, partial [Spirochaetaceae bacterium]
MIDRPRRGVFLERVVVSRTALLLILLGLFVACTPSTSPTPEASRTSEAAHETQRESAGSIPQVRHATNLRFAALPDGVEITVPEPWAGGAPIRYAVMNGNREGGEGGQQAVLRGTPQRVVVMVTPVIAHLSDLGLLDAVV